MLNVEQLWTETFTCHWVCCRPTLTSWTCLATALSVISPKLCAGLILTVSLACHGALHTGAVCPYVCASLCANLTVFTFTVFTIGVMCVGVCVVCINGCFAASVNGWCVDMCSVCCFVPCGGCVVMCAVVCVCS